MTPTFIFALALLAVLLASSQAFKPTQSRRWVSTMSLGSSPFTQRQISKGVAAVFSAFVAISPVTAANYPEVVDPAAVVLDREAINSDDFKAGLAGLKSLQASVQKLESELAKNPQASLAGALNADLSVGNVRTILNKYNTGFSEDSQRGSDRLIRLVVQDVTELERESSVKAGKERSVNKIAAVQKRLSATEKALNDLAAFYASGK